MTPTPSRGADSGLAVIDKPAGWTSHQVVGRLRRLAGTRRVGHAGTLDPMATGVLVVGLNRATRLLGHLTATEKGYAATIRLGLGTITDDAEGEVTTRHGAAGITDDQVEQGLAPLRGEILQVPCAVSAIKVGGVRSYARVRAGTEVGLAARPVTVHRLDVQRSRRAEADGVEVVDLEVVVECTSGTYVRALARDLGRALGVGGHLTALRRTRVGVFTLDDAQTLDEAAGSDGSGSGLLVIPMPEVARRCFPTVTVDERQAALVRVGRPLPELPLPGPTTALLGPDGSQFLALYRRSEGGAVPEAVFVTEPGAGAPAASVPAGTGESG